MDYTGSMKVNRLYVYNRWYGSDDVWIQAYKNCSLWFSESYWKKSHYNSFFLTMYCRRKYKLITETNCQQATVNNTPNIEYLSNLISLYRVFSTDHEVKIELPIKLNFPADSFNILHYVIWHVMATTYVRQKRVKDCLLFLLKGWCLFFVSLL